jgi:hypothetical protein
MFVVARDDLRWRLFGVVSAVTAAPFEASRQNLEEAIKRVPVKRRSRP